jgi:hypothetical protein
MSDTQYTSNIKIVPTATTIGVAGLMILSNLSEFKAQDAPSVSFEQPVYTLVESTTFSDISLSQDEQNYTAILEFANKMISTQKGLDKDIARHIEDNFFDLI